MRDDEIKELERSIEEIVDIATGFGLDFFPMRYEICPSDMIYTFGAYGMPTRYSHWSFGKQFHSMKTHYDLGLSKIYELVINSNPCYAFLMDGNSLVQNKLIAAHVIAHCDFFKNNVRFSNTNRNMVESMSASAERIRSYETEFGYDKVETFIDAVLAIQEHVDASIFKRKEYDRYSLVEKKSPIKPEQKYDDLWKLDSLHEAPPSQQPEVQRFPPHPEKDLLWFMEQFAPHLKPWQRDIMTIIREEMLYFWPQLETKIMNEGWATYWHQRILRELDLSSAETIEFAQLNASVTQHSRQSLNPYHLGLKIFEDIERRFDRDKLFEVREFEMDSSFIRNYLTDELVDELDMFVYAKQGHEWRITDKAGDIVREQLVKSRVNGGFPYLVIEDGDYSNHGELYIKHRFEGIELDIPYLEKTLPYVYQIWGNPIHLETKLENKRIVFSYDGNKQMRKMI